MKTIMRRLNSKGIADFQRWIEDGASGDIPTDFLNDPERSEPHQSKIEIDNGAAFPDRYALGVYLTGVLFEENHASLELDRGFWSAMALAFFNQLCPVDGHGRRKPLKHWHYVLSGNFRHHYRHLLRSPWQLCRDHGENARFLLLATNEAQDRLGRHGDILEQFGGRQAALRSAVLVREAADLYSDPETGRPKRGVAGNRGGSVRRLGMVLRQLDLTYDFESMGGGALINILPAEFNRWKIKTPETAAAI